MIPRAYDPPDAEAISKVALDTFEQFRSHYSDWPALAAFVPVMSILSKQGEIIIAQDHNQTPDQSPPQPALPDQSPNK